jgi:hypothetical protein
VTALAVAALLLLTIVPAAAVPRLEQPDPIADGRLYRANDIVRIRIGSVGGARLQISTRATVLPWSNPAWRDPQGDTRIVWTIDTDTDPAADYRATVRSTAEGPDDGVVVDLETGLPTCLADFSHLEPNHYRVGFDHVCFGFPQRFRARVQYRFDPPTGEARVDVAPNRGYSPWVTPPSR